MATYGLTEADYQDEFPPVLVWPDNERAYYLWCKVGGQWLVGPGCAYALNYMPLFYLMDRMKLSEDDHEELFAEIQIMEAAALKAMATE